MNKRTKTLRMVNAIVAVIVLAVVCAVLQEIRR